MFTAEIIGETRVLKDEGLDLPERFPFPFTPEEFSDQEREVLSKFFTNIDLPVFAIAGLPQEVVGAMFSRYSRSVESVRRIFLKEFWGNQELGIQNITSFLTDKGEGLKKARERAKRFYESVFAQYGDDSVIQMGSVHIGFESISQVAAKVIEDSRIAAAYIEKSTRYVDFGKPIDGHYLFMEEPTIMDSEYAQEYLDWNKSLFESYVKHFDTVREVLSGTYPLEAQTFVNPNSGAAATYSEIEDEGEKRNARIAYNRALKAKTLDTIRVFLPTTTITNLGAHFSGQAAENNLNKLISSQHPEVRLLGVMALRELMKVAPNFLAHVDHRYGQTTRAFMKDTRRNQELVTENVISQVEISARDFKARLVDWDDDADVKIAAQILYKAQSGTYHTKGDILRWARKTKKEEVMQKWDLSYSPTLTEIIVSSVPDRNRPGINRRHKLPRAFEHVYAEVEFYSDFGIYRDLQRNRMSSTERLRLSAEQVFIPKEFYLRGMEKVLADYKAHAIWTRELSRKLRESSNPKLRDASEYVTILGNRLRFNIRANLRQWAFFSELRTIPGGHPTYRRAMQSAIRQILVVYPFLGELFTHVDWTRDYGLGRLQAEVKTQEKLERLADTRN